MSVANFTFTYKTQGCGGLLSGPDAIIISPGHPGQYPSGTDCAWLVQFEPSVRIKVSTFVNHFHLSIISNYKFFCYFN